MTLVSQWHVHICTLNKHNTYIDACMHACIHTYIHIYYTWWSTVVIQAFGRLRQQRCLRFKTSQGYICTARSKQVCTTQQEYLLSLKDRQTREKKKEGRGKEGGEMM